MSGILLAASVVQSLGVEVDGGSFTTSTISPTDAVCQFRLTTGGLEQADEGSGYSTTNTWLLRGSASDYECRYSPTGDTADMSGDSIATWLALSSTRFWAITDSSGLAAVKTVTGPLEIGLAGASTALVSATLTLTADEST